MSDDSAADFLSDQLAALLASPALALVANRHTERSEGRSELDTSVYDRETEPDIEQQMLRDALRLGLKQ